MPSAMEKKSGIPRITKKQGIASVSSSHFIDLTPRNIIAPTSTSAGAVIGGARTTFKYKVATSPLRRSVELDELGGTGLYLLSDLSSAVTGEVHYVDCGFNAVGMPPHDQLDELSKNGNGSSWTLKRPS